MVPFSIDVVIFLIAQVKKSLLSGDRRILEKDDRTPVTIADFGVQALISLGCFSSLFISLELALSLSLLKSF